MEIVIFITNATREDYFIQIQTPFVMSLKAVGDQGQAQYNRTGSIISRALILFSKWQDCSVFFIHNFSNRLISATILQILQDYFTTILQENFTNSPVQILTYENLL